MKKLWQYSGCGAGTKGCGTKGHFYHGLCLSGKTSHIKTNTVIFRTDPVICIENSVIFRTNSMLFRTTLKRNWDRKRKKQTKTDRN